MQGLGRYIPSMSSLRQAVLSCVEGSYPSQLCGAVETVPTGPVEGTLKSVGRVQRQTFVVIKVSPLPGHTHKKGKPGAEGSGCLDQNTAFRPQMEKRELARGQTT